MFFFFSLVKRFFKTLSVLYTFHIKYTLWKETPSRNTIPFVWINRDLLPTNMCRRSLCCAVMHTQLHAFIFILTADQMNVSYTPCTYSEITKSQYNVWNCYVLQCISLLSFILCWKFIIIAFIFGAQERDSLTKTATHTLLVSSYLINMCDFYVDIGRSLLENAVLSAVLNASQKLN